MRKAYRQENGKRELVCELMPERKLSLQYLFYAQSLTKTRDQIRSLKKKKHSTATQQEKLAQVRELFLDKKRRAGESRASVALFQQLKQIESDQMECLHQTRVEGLRKVHTTQYIYIY